MFVLPTVLVGILYPLTLIVLLLVSGLVMIVFTRRKVTGNILILSATLFLIAVGYPFLPELLLSRLERNFDPAEKTLEVMQVQGNIPDIRWIAVLGGGHRTDPDLAANDQLAPSSLARVVEGVKLAHRFPGTTLLLSGGPVCDIRPEAQTMQQVAVSLGIASERIVLEDDAMDTAVQAQQIKRIVGNDVILLVTSTSHMMRTEALFNKHRINFIPAPTDYKIRKRTSVCSWDIFPDLTNILKMEKAVYEFIGLTWARITGKVDR